MMTRTANLRRQHDAAIDLVGQISTVLDGPPPSPMQAYALGLQLGKLTGLLRIHFAQEDKTLYPMMIGSKDDNAVATAARFQDEMGDLGATYTAFADRWNSGTTIAESFIVFRSEARIVFAALGDRIARENTMLYPLADAIRYDQIPLTA